MFSDKNGKYSWLFHREIENKSSECRVYGVYGLRCSIKGSTDLERKKDKTNKKYDWKNRGDYVEVWRLLSARLVRPHYDVAFDRRRFVQLSS